MEYYIVTTGLKDGAPHKAVPSKPESVPITNSQGVIVSSQVLPDKVQQNIEAELIRFKDSTVSDSSTLKHGFLPKLSGIASNFLNGLGQWVNPPKEGFGFGNIWWVKRGEMVTIGEIYENVVTSMVIDGALAVDGRLTIL